MEIDSKHVSEFIRFLYQNRLHQEPGEDIINSWKGLSEEDTQTYLSRLFESWNYDQDQIKTVYQEYFKTLSQAANMPPPPPPVAPVINPDPIMHSAPEPDFNSGTHHTGRLILWILLILLVVGGGFLAYKYHQFSDAHYLYVVTDNVLIRDSEGKNIGRMDIYSKGKSNSYSYLRTPDNKIYPMTIDGKVYPYRRVMFDSTGFLDFLQNKPSSFGYVNENYVIEDKDNFILYREVFKMLDQNRAESANLSSTFRNVLVGSLKLAPELKNLYITAPCRGDGKVMSNLVKYQNKQGLVQVVAQLSNGKYYIFSGNPVEEHYQVPRLFQYQNADTGEMTSFDQENILFKSVNGTYFLYDCSGNEMNYFIHVNDKGVLDYAQYSYQAQ